jgi:hypothetical protein
MSYTANGDKVEVYDLDFAAYCLMCGLSIETLENGSTTQRPHEAARFLFLFHDPEGRIDKLSIEYTNSESAKHADCVRRIKKAMRSSRGG